MQLTLPIRVGNTEGIQELGRSTAGKAFLALGATIFVALCAHISVPLYFTPVPITLQTLAVLLVGLTLGPTLGFTALALYLVEGASGLPVFSPQGPGGIAQLLGPTGGFLLSYPLAAALAGFAVRVPRSNRLRIVAAILGCCAATVVIFAVGAGWLAHLLHLNRGAAWSMAVLPFLPGECVKTGAAALAYSGLRRVLSS